MAKKEKVVKAEVKKDLGVLGGLKIISIEDTIVGNKELKKITLADGSKTILSDAGLKAQVK